MSRLGDEFANRYKSEPLSWRDYLQALEFGACEFDEPFWEDRDVIELSDNLFAVPIFRRDILQNSKVSYIQLPNLIILSWDNFSFDAVLVKDVDEETPIGWLLIEEEEEGYRVILERGNVFAILKDAIEFLQERRRI